jgi:putative tricarboxylic transport membrane protein
MGASVVAALIDVLQFQNVLAAFIGVLFGLFIGSTPGLTISLGMVLLLPITFKLEAVTSICLLLGLYASGMTGGSLSAILLNIPGTPSASATAIDGHAMAQKGRAGEALGVAVSASFFGGIGTFFDCAIGADVNLQFRTKIRYKGAYFRRHRPHHNDGGFGSHGRKPAIHLRPG